VQGSLTGADVFDNALTGADILETSLGKVPNADTLDGLDAANFLLRTQQASDSAKLGGQDPSSFLGKTQQAADSAKLGGQDPSAYGTVVYTNTESTGSAACATMNVLNACARITVTVPIGKTYRAVVWSSFTALSGTNVVSIYWCPGTSNPSVQTCATKSALIENGTTLPGGGYLGSGASSSMPISVPAGQTTFATIIDPNGPIVPDATAQTTTTVMLTDAAAPPPPLDVCYDSCSTSGGSSSGSTSGGASSSGGTTSSSGSTSGGASSSGGVTTSSGSSGSSGQTSGSSG
jgi:hypothetical protein